MSSVIKIKDLNLTLANQKILANINLDLDSNQTIGLIGPSGAGKTSLIKCLVGRQSITSGDITVFDLPAGSKKLRHELSYMTQELSVYPDLSVKENLEYFLVMSGQSRKRLKHLTKEILEIVEMTDKADVLVTYLSTGQKQRVSLAVALIGSPKLMVLDEPTVGLDPVLRAKLWNLFNHLAGKGTTLIISSHSMDEASRCDDLVLIRDGTVIAHDSPRRLLKQTNSLTIEESFLKLVKGRNV